MLDSSRKMAADKAIPNYIAPLAICVMAALLELGGETVRLALRYQRDLIADGQWWRLLSGHLVHLGWSHMLMNVAALAVLWFVLSPHLRTRDWVIAGVAAAAAIDAGLFFVDIQVQWYVGLSGVLHGFWSAASVLAWRQHRIEAAGLTGLLIAKLGYETMVGPLAFTGAIAAGPVVTQAHAWGALGGVLLPISLCAIRAAQRRL